MCTKWVWPARPTANHHETSCPSYRDTCLLVCFVFEASLSAAAERLLEYAAISTTVLHVVVCLISLFHAHAQCCCSAYVTGYWGQWTAKLALCTEFGRWPTVILIPGRSVDAYLSHETPSRPCTCICLCFHVMQTNITYYYIFLPHTTCT